MLDVTNARNDPKGIRDRAIVRALFDLALRRGELVSLDLEDLDLKARTLRVIGKGLAEKMVLTIPEKTAEALAVWLGIRGISPGPLFTNFDHARKGDGRLSGRSVHRIVKSLGDQVGLTTRPHGIRHTSVTEAVKRAQTSGIGLEEVMQFSRHKDVKTLLVYRDADRDVQGTLADLVSQAV